MMSSDLNEALRILNAELVAASEKRSELEIELREADTKIENLKKAVSRVLTLMGMSSDENISELGITDAIRRVTTETRERMTASQVREQLQKKGFSLSGYNNPMASIYKILSRLEQSGELVTEKEGWNVYYRAPLRARVHHHRRRRTWISAATEETKSPASTTDIVPSWGTNEKK
jgi:hypothetical protein